MVLVVLLAVMLLMLPVVVVSGTGSGAVCDAFKTAGSSGKC